MAATAVADAIGITIAGVVSMFLTPTLCQWQKAHGNPLCGMVNGN